MTGEREKRRVVLLLVGFGNGFLLLLGSSACLSLSICYGSVVILLMSFDSSCVAALRLVVLLLRLLRLLLAAAASAASFSVFLLPLGRRCCCGRPLGGLPIRRLLLLWLGSSCC